VARNDAAKASAGAEAKTGASGQIAAKKHNWLNIILIAVIAVIVIGLLAWLVVIPAVNSRSKSSIGTQRTASVERGSVTATVSAQGNVTAQTVDNLAFVNSGIISGLSIKVGDTVKAGQTLATQTSTTATTALDSAKAAVNQANYQILVSQRLIDVGQQLLVTGAGESGRRLPDDGSDCQQHRQLRFQRQRLHQHSPHRAAVRVLIPVPPHRTAQPRHWPHRWPLPKRRSIRPSRRWPQPRPR
jgi:predicted negative regulator of RcsB-dependent stress response